MTKYAAAGRRRPDLGEPALGQDDLGASSGGSGNSCSRSSIQRSRSGRGTSAGRAPGRHHRAEQQHERQALGQPRLERRQRVDIGRAGARTERHVAAAALADRRAERSFERARRGTAASSSRRAGRLPLEPAAADRAVLLPRSPACGARLSRVEPLAAATRTSTTGRPRRAARSIGASGLIVRPLCHGAQASPRCTSAPSRASPAGRGAGTAPVGRAGIASESACSTEIASMSGGSPTALDWKIVSSRFSAASSRRTLKTRGRSEQAGIL